jgi:hypothetical protein
MPLGCLTYCRIWCLSRDKYYILWPKSCKGAHLQTGLGDGLTSVRRCRSRQWPDEILPYRRNARPSIILRHRHVDVFEQLTSRDAPYAVGGLHNVVAGLTALFAAECVGKQERFGELTSPHQKTCAIDGPIAFGIHIAFFRCRRGRFGLACGLNFSRLRLLARQVFSFKWSDCTRTARGGQCIRIVQRWNSGPKVRSDALGSRAHRRRRRSASRTAAFDWRVENSFSGRGCAATEFAHAVHRIGTVQVLGLSF